MNAKKAKALRRAASKIVEINNKHLMLPKIEPNDEYKKMKSVYKATKQGR